MKKGIRKEEKNNKRGELVSIIFLLLLLTLLISNFSYFVKADGNQSNESNSSDITPPIVVFVSPSGKISTTSVLLVAVTNENSTCKYDSTDKEYASMIFNLDDYQTVHNKTISVSDGFYFFYVRCSDGLNVMNNSAIINFTIDTTPPSIIKYSPTGTIYEDYANLNITTNENAECKFGGSDKNYDDLDSVFSESDGINHYYGFSHLSDGEYVFYVRCKDEANNKMSLSLNLSFSIHLKPSAEISLDKDSPLKAGTYGVTVHTSKNMIAAPLLQYGFQDEDGKHSISLVGNDNLWSGYLIIAESTPNKIGSFYFSGTDTDGVTGDKITSGELFLVDTTKPPAVTSFKVTAQNDGNIKLNWFYDGEEAEKFNIYRSASSGVDYVDFYDSTSETSFVDNDVESGVIYYYKVGVVDRAGNEGQLSSEKSVMSWKTNETVEDVKVKLSPEMISKIEKTIKSIDQDSLDIDRAIQNLESVNDPKTIAIINELDLINTARNSKNSIDLLKPQLDDLKETQLSESEIDKTIEKIISNALNYKTNTPNAVDIIENTEYTQSLSNADINSAINELLLGLNITEEYKNQYTSANKNLQDLITVISEITTAKVTYLAGDKVQEFTMIEKTITSTSELENISIVENIPKEFSRRASDITFKTTPVVLMEDPIVKWDIDKMSTDGIVYRIDKIVDMSQAKNTKTVVLYKPILTKPSLNNTVGSTITGFSFLEKGLESIKGISRNTIFIFMGIIIISGLLVYYLFFLKGEETFEEKKEQNFILEPRFTKPQIIDKTYHLSTKQNKYVHGNIQDMKRMYNLLSEAHQYANNLNFGKAQELYSLLLNLYKKTEFAESRHKTMIEWEMNKIYNKLVLIYKIQEMHSHADNKDISSFRSNLVYMNRLFSVIKDDVKNTKLNQHVQDSNNYFLELNKVFITQQ